MAVTHWTTVIRQCLLNRASPKEVAVLLQQRSEQDARAIVKALLDCRQSLCVHNDPLPPRYLEILLQSRLVAVSDVLLILVRRWNHAVRSSKSPSLSEVEVLILQELSLLLASKLVVEKADTQRSLLLLSRWLTVLVPSLSQSSDSPAPPTAETVGMLLVTISATNAGVEILSQRREKDNMSKIVQSVKEATDLTTGAFTSLSIQLIQRLEAVQKHIAMFDEAQQPQSAMQALQIQSNVPEIPMSASSTGTMLYLEALIVTARTIDDTIVFNFLAGRHNNDWAAMFHDILHASFKILKKSQTSPRKHLQLPQSQLFIRNKLPAILATISGSSFGMLSADDAVRTVWAELKPQLDEELLLIGQQFLHVCLLHHLVSSDLTSQLINDHDMVSQMPKGLYSKDDLISQVAINHSRINKLVEELSHAQGSAAAISQAIVEIVMTYCQNKETHHLEDIANALVKNPGSINSLAMFIRPSYWLGPLCSLLDEWRWDDIHGESQPVYGEFGSVLLLIIASKRRLALSISDLGLQEGFVARYFDQEGSETSILSEESSKHLGDWISALYIAEGLSDEVTTTCSPQDFYMLVPTLLSQSMYAYQKGRLTIEALKGGLDYFLEPFLLPSLVTASEWAARNPKAAAVMNPILSKTTGNEIQQTINTMMVDSSWSFELERTAKFDQAATSYIMNGNGTLVSSLHSLIQLRGGEAALVEILQVLSSSWPSALDMMATLVCVEDRSLRDLLRIRVNTLKEEAGAETVVHLHRRVEAYASVLIVQDLGMEFLPLNNIDNTNANLDVTQEQPVDDIDRVLNETAAMGGAMDQPDLSTDVNMDDFYGLQGDDNMALGNLDDLDLDMF